MVNKQKDVEVSKKTKNEDVVLEEVDVIKKKNSKKVIKATFLQRFGAYLLDMIIIGICFSFLASFLFKDNSVETTDKQTDLVEKFYAQEITVEEYINSYKVIVYKNGRDNFNSNIFSLILTTVYFVVIQFIYKGQTVGKKVFKIKIVKKNGELEAKDIVIRALLIDGILNSLLGLILIMILDVNNYFFVGFSISTILELFVLISGIMVLFRNDKLGLHDILTKTEVVREI